MSNVFKISNDQNRYLSYYLDNCVRCGACVESCHFYQGDRSNPLHAPVYKNELIRRSLKSKTLLGKLGLYGSGKVKESDVEYAVYQSCTNCRRCVTYCPLGLDPSLINTVARGQLVQSGKEPQMLLELSNMQLARRENPESFIGGLKTMLGSLENQIKGELGASSFRIPLSEKGVDMLYVPLSGQHSIIPAAKIFNAAGEKWTMSLYDAANYGFLASDTEMAKKLTKPIIDEAVKVGAKKVVISECGHAYRVMKQFAELWFGKLPFEVELITETSVNYIKDNQIQVDKSKNKELFTHHDPCQHARNGGILEEPRYVLKHTVERFVEMTPNREHNWCCGGGGGVVAVPDFDETRLAGGKMKSEQIKKTEAQVVTTTCDNCKLQLSDLVQHYGLNVRIEGIIDVTSRALIYPKD